MTRSPIIVIALIVGAGVCLAQDVEAANHARSYEPLIIEAAIKHRVDPRLLWTVSYLETRFQPREVSPKGARGLMQFMPATARRYGLSDPFDLAEEIDAVARYLCDIQAMFGNRLDLLLARITRARNGRGIQNRTPPGPVRRQSDQSQGDQIGHTALQGNGQLRDGRRAIVQESN